MPGGKTKRWLLLSCESESVEGLAARHKTQSKVPSIMAVCGLDKSRGTVLNVHDHQLTPSHLSI